jgi:hypothetical protein
VAQQDLHYGCPELGTLGALAIARKASYGYQLVRIYGRNEGPLVEFVRDAYTKSEELAVAKYILENHSVEVRDSAR